jgi:hypothetical protein
MLRICWRRIRNSAGSPSKFVYNSQRVKTDSCRSACITALSNSQLGIIVLPATIQLCDALAKLAMTLDKRPDLTRRLRKVANIDSGETRKSLVEGTAESIQRAFTMCLTERSSNRNGIKDGKPEGKKIGIYSFANLVLKLLFQVCWTSAID